MACLKTVFHKKSFPMLLNHQIPSRFIVSGLFVFAFAFMAIAQQPRTAQQVWGPRYHSAPQANDRRDHGGQPADTLDRLKHWNEIAINASGLDHTPVAPGETRVFGEQLGPGRASRAMAIVHIAIFDSVNAVLGGYQSYSGIQPVKPPVSLDAAIAQAAHDTLVAMFPSQAPAFDSFLADDLAKISNKNERANGVSSGHGAAADTLA